MPQDRPKNTSIYEVTVADCWFSVNPSGHSWFQTTHSLLLLFELYQAGLDEQVVMERTAHRSLHGVQSFNPLNPIDVFIRLELLPPLYSERGPLSFQQQ